MDSKIVFSDYLPMKLCFTVSGDSEAVVLQELLDSVGDIEVLWSSTTKGKVGIRSVTIGKRTQDGKKNREEIISEICIRKLALTLLKTISGLSIDEIKATLEEWLKTGDVNYKE